MCRPHLGGQDSKDQETCVRGQLSIRAFEGFGHVPSPPSMYTAMPTRTQMGCASGTYAHVHTF